MSEMTQNERLDYLVEAFIKDSIQYSHMEIPAETQSKKQILRSLMNIRMPKPISAQVLTIQDEYLKERNRENGIVELNNVPTIASSGSKHIHAEHLSLWQGDITRLAADAIVNAANSQMLGCFVPMHTCIDNCIHTYAGIQLRAECNRQMNEMRIRYGKDYEQPTAKPMMTDGYNLPAKKIIHVVGPIVSATLTKELEQDLADCYINTLDLCLENHIRSVAFCCISTGVFRFPNQDAARIAVKAVTDWLTAHPGGIDRVIFDVYKDEDKEYYGQELY